MKIYEIVALCNQYGENTTLAEIRQSIQGKKKHLCPKCDGTGNILREFYNYPTIYFGSSPYGATCRKCECDLCKGEGYIDKSTTYKAQENMAQDYNYVRFC